MSCQGIERAGHLFKSVSVLLLKSCKPFRLQAIRPERAN
jgi:hypothetical protein